MTRGCWPGCGRSRSRCRSKFRGITVREGALIEGPAGWGEFSPFAEYGPRECARWLASALESATGPWPAPVRDRIPVNVTVPAVGPRAGACRSSPRRAAGRRRSRWPSAARPRPRTSSGSRRSATRSGLGGRIRVDANGGWERRAGGAHAAAAGRFGLEYAEQPCATLDELAELRRARRRPGRGGRVHPPGRGPAAGPGRGRGRHRDAEGPAARRGAGRAAGGRGLRAAGRGVQRGRHLGRAGRRGGAGRGAARAARTPAAWPRCRCWPATSPPIRWPRAGRAAGPAARGRPGPAGPLGGRPGAVAGAGRGGGRSSSAR